MIRQLLSIAIIFFFANDVFALPYKAETKVSGTIRSWGNNEMLPLLKLWQKGFQKYQPDTKFEEKLFGSGTGVAGLYTSVADLGLLGREVNSTEILAYEWVFRYKPFDVEVASGSFNQPGKTPAVGIIVNKDNPLKQLNFEQLDAIFGAEHKRGTKNIRTWGELGLSGKWADKPIIPYGYEVNTGTAVFFRQAVMNDSFKWNCALHEFAPIKGDDSGERILQALAKDKYGIAFVYLPKNNKKLKALAIASNENYVELTRENVQNRKYPLSREIRIVFNREPNKPFDPKVKELLKYILSNEGQKNIVEEGDYLPLTKEQIVSQLKRLE